ncbi:MAG: (2Fe-2S)-binding protein, partial [Gemmatimonadales bacterium]|nr:(2Fe-2S)-binding protein [Gemmatimonadales bacterium]
MSGFVQLTPVRRTVEVTIDGEKTQVPEGTTIFQACQQQGNTLPTLCYLETLHPVTACRVCVVEV